MEILRQPEIVEGYHFDMIKEHEEVGENDISVGLTAIDVTEQPDLANEDHSVLGLHVQFKIVMEKFVLSGSVRQLVSVVDKKVEKAEDCTKEELDELIRPLFSIIERLTYEVTEIALDQPGLQLNFNS